MTYKDKKLKEFEKSFFGHKSAFGQSTLIPKEGAKDFLSSTIDEIMACLPAESENKDWDFHEGFMVCRNLFLLKLEQKAGEL